MLMKTHICTLVYLNHELAVVNNFIADSSFSYAVEKHLVALDQQAVQ